MKNGRTELESALLNSPPGDRKEGCTSIDQPAHMTSVHSECSQPPTIQLYTEAG